MESTRQAGSKKIGERIWDLAQKILAPLIVFAVIASFTVVTSVGNRFGAIDRRIDIELKEINGKSIRDNVIDLLHEVEANRKLAVSTEIDLNALDKQNHEEHESLAILISNITTQCNRVTDKLDWYYDNEER